MRRDPLFFESAPVTRARPAMCVIVMAGYNGLLLLSRKNACSSTDVLFAVVVAIFGILMPILSNIIKYMEI